MAREMEAWNVESIYHAIKSGWRAHVESSTSVGDTPRLSCFGRGRSTGEGSRSLLSSPTTAARMQKAKARQPMKMKKSANGSASSCWPNLTGAAWGGGGINGDGGGGGDGGGLGGGGDGAA